MNTDTSQQFGKIGAVMLKLAEQILNNVGHNLHMDNLFSTCDLFTELRSRGIWPVGIVHNNRLKGSEKVMKSKNELEREGPGSMDHRVDINTNTTLVRWIDNGMVQTLPTFVGPEMGDQIQRRNIKKKK